MHKNTEINSKHTKRLLKKTFQGGFMPTSQPVQQQQMQSPAVDKDTPTSNRNLHSFFHNNSQLSQITTSDTVVSRRLFGTPMTNVSNRISSTPFAPQHGADSQNAYRHRFAIDEVLDEDDFENNYPAVDLNPRKRRLDDLFGNIDDIVREENLAQVFYNDDPEENAKKKARSEEEMDRELIHRILSARAETRAKTSNFIKQSKLQQLEELQKFKSRNLSSVFPNWPCIPVAAGDDQSRVYVRMHSEEFETKQLGELNLKKTLRKLLGEQSEDIWVAAQAIVEKRMLNETAANTQATLSAIEEAVIISEITPNNVERLWVEKYKPKGYCDLLSDESTNRSLLTWLKMWDKIVFGK